MPRQHVWVSYVRETYNVSLESLQSAKLCCTDGLSYQCSCDAMSPPASGHYLSCACLIISLPLLRSSQLMHAWALLFAAHLSSGDPAHRRLPPDTSLAWPKLHDSLASNCCTVAPFLTQATSPLFLLTALPSPQDPCTAPSTPRSSDHHGAHRAVPPASLGALHRAKSSWSHTPPRPAS